METTTFALFAVAVTLGLGLVVAGIAVRRSRPRLGFLMSVVGGVTALAVIAVPVIAIAMPAGRDTVWVSGGASETRFELEVAHSGASVEGSRYVFTADLTWEEVLVHARDQHPSGVVTDQGWWWMGMDDSVIVLSQAPGAPGEFVASVQEVIVDQDGNLGSTVYVPFPVFAAGRDVISWGDEVQVGWPLDRWQEFYALIDIEPDGRTFTVPTDGGSPANVEVDGEGNAIVVRQ